MKFKLSIPVATLLIVVAIFFSACKSQKYVLDEQSIVLDTVNVKANKADIYHGSRTKKIDILHTKLNLSFNWDSAFVYGKAELTLKPHFYSIKSLELDARGFEIEGISLLSGDKKEDIKYEYDGKKIDIILPALKTVEDTIELSINYTAMPEKLTSEGSSAISDNRGMYFINRDGKNAKKPRQLWTQGETEANSGWFPTVDSPNEKFTHEIYVTIDDNETSISNGLKMFSLDNSDGTKTEYWKMDMPHSAYLVMLAVGPFSKYEDKWNDMEVNYFLDSAYLPYAKDIFGNTPEMLDFYSDFLGYPYPWQKYDQVIVHDFVSGAMENTTATIHGNFLHQTKRELLDYDNEDVIAHELFHHWFGDLLTCESWSNLTLNEGFATYGEYLWQEYKYGRDVADFSLRADMESYLREAKTRNVDMIRFTYDDKEDMFDSHSYSKGGVILHMLRHYVGDEAFRASLKLYLEKHAFKNVEIHDLRMAFEEVTGEDLNWFFNQWFLASGHPELDAYHSYSEVNKRLEIYVSQLQDLEKSPLYRLPVRIEYKLGDEVFDERFVVEKAEDTIFIEMMEKPHYVNFDPGKTVLSTIDYRQSDEEWTELYKNAKLGIDKRKAIAHLSDNVMKEENREVFTMAKEDSLWEIRSYALEYFTNLLEKNKSDSIKEIVMNMAKNDEEWRIRYMALRFLREQYKDDDIVELCKSAISDESIMVTSGAIRSLTEVDPEEAKKIIPTITDLEYSSIASAVAAYYTSEGGPEDHARLLEVMEKVEGYPKYQVLKDYGSYLDRLDVRELRNSIAYLEDASLNSSEWWIRMAAINEVINVHSRLKAAYEKSQKESLDSLSEGKKDENVDAFAQSALDFVRIDEVLKEIKETETRDNLISVVNDYLESGKLPKK